MPPQDTLRSLRESLQKSLQEYRNYDFCRFYWPKIMIGLWIVISIICGIVIGAQQHELDYKIFLTTVVAIVIGIVLGLLGPKSSKLCEFVKERLARRA